MNSPLETFEVLVYYPYSLSKCVDLTLTNIVIYYFIIAALIIPDVIRGKSLIPSLIQWVTEKLLCFIYWLVKDQTEGSGEKYFPLLFTIFFFILLGNLIGLFPFSFTVTSHFALTFGLALSLNLGILWIGLRKNGIDFFKLFVPSGAPVYLLPLIIIIEVVSYMIRTFSLSIRLFANMMAGHTLLHILATFTVRLESVWFFPFFLIIGVLCLELGIVFIQAYVFTILTIIYLNDSFHPGH
jgi:F-type H+-transporting ATPase subunit a